jgi:hypothetical protein
VSDALIASLNNRVSELTTALAKANAEAKQRRHQRVATEKKLAELATAHEALAAEHGKLKAAADATPGQLQTENTELKGKLRAIGHKEAFAEALKSAKGADGKPLALNQGATIETLWGQIKYEVPDADPDPKKITELIGEAVTAHPFLFTTAPDGARGPGGSTGSKPPLNPAPGGGRGRLDMANDKVYVRESELRDPKFAYENSKRLGEAQKAGKLEIIEGQ